MTVSTTIPCPAGAPSAVGRARPEGLTRAVMLAGVAMTRWARERADAKALRRSRSPLSGLSDSERMELYRDATVLRDAVHAERARWHAIG